MNLWTHLADSLWHPTIIPSGFFPFSFTQISTLCFTGARSSNRMLLALAALEFGTTRNSAHNLSPARPLKTLGQCLCSKESAWLALKYNFFQIPDSSSKFSRVSLFDLTTYDIDGSDRSWLLSTLKRLRQIMFSFVSSLSLLHVQAKLSTSLTASR